MSIYIAFKDSTNPSRQPQKELSLETDDSGSPRDMSRQTVTAIKPSNEKSQLCKKFMENGNCPYQKKCKFAHGSH